MEPLRAMYLSGYFDDQDWTLIVRTLQAIEARHPEETYRATVAQPDLPAEAALELLDRTPPLPGYERIAV